MVKPWLTIWLTTVARISSEIMALLLALSLHPLPPLSSHLLPSSPSLPPSYPLLYSQSLLFSSLFSPFLLFSPPLPFSPHPVSLLLSSSLFFLLVITLSVPSCGPATPAFLC